MRLRLLATAIATWGMVTASTAHAQDFERTGPRELPRVAPQVDRPALPAAEADDAERVILPELKGVAFVAGGDLIQPSGITAEGIRLVGELPLLADPEFQRRIESYLGAPLTMGVLRSISRDVVKHYRAQGRPLVDVVVPEQDISAGTVQIAVVEFRAGQVLVEGNQHFGSEQLLSEVRTQPGDVIVESELIADLDWLNRNPFRRIDLVYQKSEEAGLSDVILRTSDRFPLRVYGGIENTGQASIGRNRLLAGFNWGDAWGLGHQLSYQASSSGDLVVDDDVPAGQPDDLRFFAHALSYRVPLPWRHELNVFGAYAKSRPVLPAPFAQDGRAIQLGARYAIPLPRFASVRHELRLGADFKRFNSDLEFGGTRVGRSDTDVVQGVLEYWVEATDPLGVTAFTGGLYVSPGELSAHNDQSDYAAARAGAEPDYHYVRLGLERLTELPYDADWSLRGTVQFAPEPLLSSEQIGLGGWDSVRGFAERDFNGDEGWLLINELRSPPVSLAGLLDIAGVTDEFRALAFLDVGRVMDQTARAGLPNDATLVGAGIGFRYSLASNLSVRADYGWPLDGLSTGANDDGRLHFALLLSY